MLRFRSSWVLLLACAACSAPRTGTEVDALLNQTMQSMQMRLDQDQAAEAFQLAQSIRRVDPAYPGLGAASEQMPPGLESVFERPVLGSNYAARMPIDPPWYRRVLLYVPDRLLDVLDVFSFDVHVGFGAYADVHVTRLIGASGGFRTVCGFGWHDHRSLGVQTQAQAGVSALTFGAEGYAGTLLGTSGVRSGSWSVAGVHWPTDEVYQDYRDFWAIGAGVTAGVAGVDVDIHPMQILDLVAGLLFFDPLNDDFATTSGLDLMRVETMLIKSLAEVAGSEEELENYHLWRGQQPADGADGEGP